MFLQRTTNNVRPRQKESSLVARKMLNQQIAYLMATSFRIHNLVAVLAGVQPTPLVSWLATKPRAFLLVTEVIR